MEQFPAPVTPLGARTPLAHPGLYVVIAGLGTVIVIGTLWVFWPRTAVAPKLSPSPVASSLSTEYRNDQYGFMVSLSKDWSGFAVLQQPDIFVSPPGTQIILRHPKWTTQHPYQDLPILIYPLSEWPCIQDENGACYQGAAPFPPTELARNARYVFALPPRYNYGFHEGWQTLEQLLLDGAVRAF